MKEVKSFILIFYFTSVAAQQQYKYFGLDFHQLASSDLCSRQLKYFQTSLDQNARWARLMHDAWGSIPSGIFSGNLFDFGNFDQCVNLQHESSVGEILGQHCTLMIPFNLEQPDGQLKFMPPSRR